MIGNLDSAVPAGPIGEKWTQHKFDMKLVAPNNRRKFEVIVVGTGLAGAAAAATLGEQGYKVKAITYHDSPRRAHSIAAQGGINAAKNYKNDGDSVYRLFYDTVKGGDYRSREANVHRLAEVSGDIIDQCVAQGVPFAREYGGMLDNRSFGGAQVSRTFYARGQTGQQLLLGAYQALMKEVHNGTVELITKTEVLDLVVKDGVARGVVTRDLRTGAVQRHSAHAVLLCTGGYGNVFYLSTNAKYSNATAAWRAHKRGATVRQPLLHPDPPDVHPAVGGVPVQAHAHVGVAAQRRSGVGARRTPTRPGRRRRSPTPTATTSSSASTRASATWSPATSPPATPRRRSTRARASGRARTACTSTSPTRSAAWARTPSASATGTCSTCTSASRTRTRTRSRCASTRPSTTRWAGSGWTTTSCPTCPACSCSARRTSPTTAPTASGASALMQGLADGYFVISHTLANYLAGILGEAAVPVDDPAFDEAEAETSPTGSSSSCRSVAPSPRTSSTRSSARSCGTTAAWPATRPGLQKALVARSRRCARSSTRTSACSARARA